MEARKRTPYESEERLQDPAQKRQLTDILGLDDDKLTNSDPLPLPHMVGAGRVKKFRDDKKADQAPSAHEQVSSSDVEFSSNPPPVPGDHHPRGYPALASFIGSDKDFFIFRRFNALSARSLLYLQDELIELEDKLLEIDLRESRSGGQLELWNLHSRREDSNRQRKALMAEAQEKLREYQSALHSQALTLALESAPGIHVESIVNWIDGIKPTVETESHYLDKRDDLASLAGGHATKELLEHYLERNWYQFFRAKRKSQESGPQLSSTVDYYSTNKIKHAARILLAIVAVVFAVLPVPILVYFASPGVRISIIAAFAVAFAATFSVMTHSRTPEIFAAMAAYAAFLFLPVFANGPPPSVPSGSQ